MCQMDMQSGTVFSLFRLSNPPTPNPPAMHYAAGSTSSRSGREEVELGDREGVAERLRRHAATQR